LNNTDVYFVLSNDVINIVNENVKLLYEIDLRITKAFGGWNVAFNLKKDNTSKEIPKKLKSQSPHPLSQVYETAIDESAESS
jgi:hypothetical protein